MYFCLVLANFYRVLKINKLMNRGRRLLRRKLITTRIKTKNKVSRLNLSNVSTFTGESVFLFINFFLDLFEFFLFFFLNGSVLDCCDYFWVGSRAGWTTTRSTRTAIPWASWASTATTSPYAARRP